MKEVFAMWRHTQLVVLTALSAAIYAAVLIPFKGFPIVPGFIELRPANVFPVVFGLLFGPAGAWGAAIGNLIGDFFGTLSIASAAGFVGNFFLAYLPYKMWGYYFREDENMEQNVNSGKKLAVYVALALLASIVCALIIAWFIALLRLVHGGPGTHRLQQRYHGGCAGSCASARPLSAGQAVGTPLDRDNGARRGPGIPASRGR